MNYILGAIVIIIMLQGCALGPAIPLIGDTDLFDTRCWRAVFSDKYTCD